MAEKKMTDYNALSRPE